MILEGATNATAFEIYVEQLLVPSLQAGQIVVLEEAICQALLTVTALSGARVVQPLWVRSTRRKQRWLTQYFGISLFSTRPWSWLRPSPERLACASQVAL